ncbi:MAG: hypothetical protein KAS32_05425 [Candidatus Peribacteraceae bacterium]|nr:hypothetical protein [Candidatus Peribacteraceae bacterium]
MALTCSTSSLSAGEFEFIDCSTLSISYSQRGIASVSFTVVSTSESLLNNYTNISFGGVNFQLTLRDITISLIPGTLVYTFQVSLIGFGC